MMDGNSMDTNVRVFTRVRPLLLKEKLNGEESCVKIAQDLKQIVIGKDRSFTFDGVFGHKSTQEEMYDTAVKDLILNLFEGYNSTIFAYGQTGSGKTYTMGTFNQEELLEEEKGIVPRAVEEIFRLIYEKDDKRKFSITASFIEVYKEEVRDLLDPTGSCSGQEVCNVQIREDENGNTIISGIYEHLCEKVTDLLECLEMGSSNRVTGATQMNEHSSRSHCVFTVTLIQEWFNEFDEHTESASVDIPEGDNKSIISGKFHFVDLAGSERAHKTGNVGDRFKESIHINSGLLALGNVISALGDPKKKKGIHIPYRESKITRILKDSLGGNARTLMICCISPAVSNYDETVNALKYANRARNIRNKPIVNHDKTTKKIVRMQTEILALRQQLSRQKGDSKTESQTPELENYQIQNSVLEKTFVGASKQQTKLQELYLYAREVMHVLLDSFCRGHNGINFDLLSRIEDWVNLGDDIDFQEFESALLKDCNRSLFMNVSDVSERMKININKLKQDLVNDVDMHAQKSNQLVMKDQSIRELEVENTEVRKELVQLRSKLRDYEIRLVEQQREVTQYRRELRRYQCQNHHYAAGTHNTVVNNEDNQNSNYLLQYNFSAIPQMSPNKEVDSNKRIKSSPIFTSKDRTNLKTDICNQRNIKSSPHILNPELMVSRFHAQSNFLLTEFENDDEIIRPTFDDSVFTSAREEKSKEKPEFPSSKHSGKISFSSQNSNEDTKNKAEETFNTSDIYKKQIKVSQLKLTDANQKLRDLAINIRLKEQLISDLLKSAKDSNKVNRNYEDKILILEKEKEQITKDVNKLQLRLAEISKDKDNENVEVKKIKELSEIISDYEKKIETAQKKLVDLQKKQKETQKLTLMTSNHDKKVKELMSTVERLKQDQVGLQKKLKGEAETKLKLERDLQRDQEKIKQLELQTEHQQKVLKRKQEEIMAANRRLRKGSNVGLVTGNEETNSKVEEQKKWLDEEIEKIILYKKQMDDVEIDLKKREDILNKREQLLIERSEFYSTPKESNETSNDHALTLALERDNLRAQKSKLEEKLKSGFVLSDKEERWISELDEAIEALDEAIEFKTECIQTKQEALRQSQINILMSREDIIKKLTQIGTEETQQLLMRYFEKVIDLREKLRKNELVKNSKDIQIDELQKIKDQLQRNLEKQNLDFDRKFTQMQTNLESEKQLLLHQIATAATYSSAGDTPLMEQNSKSSNVNSSAILHHKDVTMLKEKCSKVEKEAALYKKMCRDMKAKIKDWVQSGRLKVDMDTYAGADNNSGLTTPVGSKVSRPGTGDSAGAGAGAGGSSSSSTNAKKSSQQEQQKWYNPGNYVKNNSNIDNSESTSVLGSARSARPTTIGTMSENVNSQLNSRKPSLVTYSSAAHDYIASDVVKVINSNKSSTNTKITPTNSFVNRINSANSRKSDNRHSPEESPLASVIDSLDANLK